MKNNEDGSEKKCCGMGVRDKKGEIDLRYFDEAGWGMRACIPMGGKKKMSQ